MEIKLPKDVTFIANLYKKAGKEIFVVGGAVRDAIRGIPPKDFDLATNANPEETIKILQKHFNVQEVGKAFGVIVAITKEFPKGIEISTFREDIGTGRRPDSVKFSTIETDVLRRDLTINALFYNIDTKEIIDLVGGKKDIEEGIIRAVGIPEDRFIDDPLRRLRAIRFQADLDGELENELYKSLEMSSDISSVSKDRIKDEFFKLLSRAKNINSTFKLLEKFGFLSQVFPNLSVKIDKHGKLPLVTAALMLRDNVDEISEEIRYPMQRLQKQLNVCRWLSSEIDIICYLIRLLDLKPDNAFQLKMAERRTKITQEEVEELLIAGGKWQELIDAFLEYKVTVKPDDLSAEGFEGIPLGRERERRETILFNEVLKIQKV